MKKWKWLLFLAIPLAVGGLAALLAGDIGQVYRSLNQPPLSPPGWIFPVVWTVLYLLMGWASWLVYTAQVDGDAKRKGLTLYGLQLAVNGLWPILFFRFQWFLFALLWLIALWVLILLTMQSFSRIREKAGDLLLPYLIWVTFAGYLNFGVFLLN